MPEEFVLEKYVVRMIVRGVLGLLLVAAIAYPLDWAVWRTRVAMGGGMGSVQVSLFTVADLKGGKEDYYPQGDVTVPCSKSLYPQGGNGACWWVERHREVVQHY
jgi:hypothetical protein